MIPAKFEYVRPGSVDEAIRALADGGDDAKVIAGGQSLLPLLRLRLAYPELLVDVGGLDELRGVTDAGDALVIGARTTHYQLVHDEIISIGSMTSNIIHPREVFRPAIEYSASAVILAHNHPSGVAKPSEPDVAITAQIVEAGKILGISVLDHVIITKTKFASVPVEYN